MPFTMPDYPMLRPEQVNRFNAALKQAFQTYGQGLQAAYAKPNMEQSLQKSILENQWNPQKWQSEIGLRGAETDKLRFLVNNPQYINADAAILSMALNRGNQGNSQGQQGANSQQGQDYQLTPQEREQRGNMQPGDSMVVGMGANGQQSGSRQGYVNDSYNPSALAYSPPSLPSPTGNPQADNLYFKRYGFDPYTQAQMELAKGQAEKYQSITNDKNAELNLQARFANQSTIDAHKFLDALDRSSSLQTGYFGSKTPAIRDAEQEMDAYGNNMAAAATQLFKNGGAIHDSDIELQKLAKPNRSQNKDVSFDLANGVISKNDRLKEQQQFYALGTQQRIKPEILDAMWNQYETERPYMDTETKMPNDAYKGSWKDYLSPQAINSFLAGKDYIPPNQKALQGMNWTKENLEKIQKWAKAHNKNPKDYDKKSLYQAAKEEGITLSQLKLELMRNGVNL